MRELIVVELVEIFCHMTFCIQYLLVTTIEKRPNVSSLIWNATLSKKQQTLHLTCSKVQRRYRMTGGKK